MLWIFSLSFLFLHMISWKFHTCSCKKGCLLPVLAQPVSCFCLWSCSMWNVQPCTGYKFLCWSSVSAIAGATWATDAEHNIWLLLLSGSDLCEEKCDRNKGKIASRNRDCSSSTRIEVLLTSLVFSNQLNGFNCTRVKNVHQFTEFIKFSWCYPNNKWQIHQV